jgi:magnesium transporter
MNNTDKISNLDNLKNRLESGRMLGARNLINNLLPSELAKFIESLPLKERAIIWEMIELKNKGDVVVEVADEVRDGLIEGMKANELIAAIEGMALDDLADLVADLPETLTQEVIRSLDHQDRERLTQVLAFDENSAGGLMNIDIITVRPDVTIEVVLKYLRNQKSIPQGTDSIYVVNRDNIYKGALLLSSLVTEDPEKPVSEIMSKTIIPILAATPSE